MVMIKFHESSLAYCLIERVVAIFEKCNAETAYKYFSPCRRWLFLFCLSPERRRASPSATSIEEV